MSEVGVPPTKIPYLAVFIAMGAGLLVQLLGMAQLLVERARERKQRRQEIARLKQIEWRR